MQTSSATEHGGLLRTGCILLESMVLCSRGRLQLDWPACCVRRPKQVAGPYWPNLGGPSHIGVADPARFLGRIPLQLRRRNGSHLWASRTTRVRRPCRDRSDRRSNGSVLCTAQWQSSVQTSSIETSTSSDSTADESPSTTGRVLKSASSNC